MSNGAVVAASAHAAIAQAIKASGAIVQVEPSEFVKLVSRQRDALIVYATGGFIHTNYQYLAGYKGLVFYTKSNEPLPLPPHMETIAAKKIWIPG